MQLAGKGNATDRRIGRLYTHTHTHARTNTHTQTHARTRAHTHICTCLKMEDQLVDRMGHCTNTHCTHTHIATHVRTHTHTHTYTHICTTFTHAYSLTHTHIHTTPPSLSLSHMHLAGIGSATDQYHSTLCKTYTCARTSAYIHTR